MKTGTYPDCLKLARVIPIHKKDQNLKLITIDQSLSCQISIKYLKNCSWKNIQFSGEIKLSLQVSIWI